MKNYVEPSVKLIKMEQAMMAALSTFDEMGDGNQLVAPLNPNNNYPRK